MAAQSVFYPPSTEPIDIIGYHSVDQNVLRCPPISFDMGTIFSPSLAYDPIGGISSCSSPASDTSSTQSSRPASRRRSPTHIPRPRNPFLIFRSEFVAQAKLSVVERDHRHISRIAGHLWNKFSDDEKEPYRVKAAQEKLEHQRKYPGYRFTPVTRTTKPARRNVKRNGKQDLMRCEKVAELLKAGKQGDELESAIQVIDAAAESGATVDQEQKSSSRIQTDLPLFRSTLLLPQAPPTTVQTPGIQRLNASVADFIPSNVDWLFSEGHTPQSTSSVQSSPASSQPMYLSDWLASASQSPQSVSPSISSPASSSTSNSYVTFDSPEQCFSQEYLQEYHFPQLSQVFLPNTTMPLEYAPQQSRYDNQLCSFHHDFASPEIVSAAHTPHCQPSSHYPLQSQPSPSLSCQHQASPYTSSQLNLDHFQSYDVFPAQVPPQAEFYSSAQHEYPHKTRDQVQPHLLYPQCYPVDGDSSEAASLEYLTSSGTVIGCGADVDAWSAMFSGIA